ncbi:hypothetical protein C8Q80DRAFT_1122979 [Daedaleopsis nitida]|nr:hypothetical protein C8Q80DRAFT_1122979 [Daedaleopsis nitida]
MCIFQHTTDIYIGQLYSADTSHNDNIHITQHWIGSTLLVPPVRPIIVGLPVTLFPICPKLISDTSVPRFGPTVFASLTPMLTGTVISILISSGLEVVAVVKSVLEDANVVVYVKIRMPYLPGKTVQLSPLMKITRTLTIVRLPSIRTIPLPIPHCVVVHDFNQTRGLGGRDILPWGTLDLPSVTHGVQRRKEEDNTLHLSGDIVLGQSSSDRLRQGSQYAKTSTELSRQYGPISNMSGHTYTGATATSLPDWVRGHVVQH